MFNVSRPETSAVRVSRLSTVKNRKILNMEVEEEHFRCLGNSKNLQDYIILQDMVNLHLY